MAGLHRVGPRRSHRTTDGDIARLTEAGHAEDETYEMTVAAPVGVATRRFPG